MKPFQQYIFMLRDYISWQTCMAATYITIIYLCASILYIFKYLRYVWRFIYIYIYIYIYTYMVICLWHLNSCWVETIENWKNMFDLGECQSFPLSAFCVPQRNRTIPQCSLNSSHTFHAWFLYGYITII